MRGRCLSLAKVFTLLLPSFIHVIDSSCPIYSARFCSLARGRFLDVQLGHMTPRQREDDNNLSVGHRNHLKLGIEPESWLQSHELGF